MIENLSHFTQAYLLPLGFFGVFLASILEEVIAPIPSALVMMTAGFLFVTGPVSLATIWELLFYVVLPAALGVSIGSLAVYGIAYWGGKPLLLKYGKWLGLYWSDVEKLDARLEETKKEEVIIITARVIPFVPSIAISAFCGFIRMKVWKYLWITFTGMFVRALIMGAIGWQVGNIYERYASQFARLENNIMWIIAAIVAIFLGGLIFRRYQARIKNHEV